MELRDSLNQFYYNMTVADLRHLSRSGGSGGSELSYNSILYLDVISYQQANGRCTITTLAQTLHITRSAATLKVTDLEKLGMVVKERGCRPSYGPLKGAVVVVQHLGHAVADPQIHHAMVGFAAFTPRQIKAFCSILEIFSAEFMKES